MTVFDNEGQPFLQIEHFLATVNIYAYKIVCMEENNCRLPLDMIEGDLTLYEGLNLNRWIENGVNQDRLLH